MIFARRALQRRLNELRPIIGSDPASKLANRANRRGKDCLSVIWEIAFLHALSQHGSIKTEAPIQSGRCPDVKFDDGTLGFVADVTVVSDDGLDESNPYSELSEILEKAKSKLGLPIGGLDLRVMAREEPSSRGSRTVLRLPARRDLRSFVQSDIIPQFKKQMDAGASVLRVSVDDEKAGVEITYDPRRSPTSMGSHASYTTPTIRDRNPLYTALKAKAGQLKGAEGLQGIIVCDGGCDAMNEPKFSRRPVSPQAIVGELFRQHSSVDFVFLISVEESRSYFGAGPTTRTFRTQFISREPLPQLEELLSRVVGDLPKPVMSPSNASLRAREGGYYLGNHGGLRMEGKTLRVSAREMVEVLAGARTFQDEGAKNVEAARRHRVRPSQAAHFFARNLAEGRLPSKIEVIKTDEDDNDDWIEFEFGEPDPAISPLA